ncbi:MAG TPA: hypothetical protein VFX16_04885 [Pseudonocardiaceae bacterium]|nr:hypothetical protein [Pseudonocardiaceae bacterium]
MDMPDDDAPLVDQSAVAGHRRTRDGVVVGGDVVRVVLTGGTVVTGAVVVDTGAEPVATTVGPAGWAVGAPPPQDATKR